MHQGTRACRGRLTIETDRRETPQGRQVSNALGDVNSSAGGLRMSRVPFMAMEKVQVQPRSDQSQLFAHYSRRSGRWAVRVLRVGVVVGLALLLGGVAGSLSVAGAQVVVPAPPATLSAQDSVYIAKARADSARHPYTQADVDFMTGMIAHHSQAIVMARWAPSHGASASVQTLCSRIINAQTDEIVIMQRWLRDRQQPVPAANASGMMMMMNGHEQAMLMPGMLTQAQMQQLDAARGPEFDHLFLTFMIQHHKGAVAMVKELFSTYGAALDYTVFKFAADVNIDQTTEIARMQQMLALETLGVGSP